MTRKERGRRGDIREQWKPQNVHNARRERGENKSNNTEDEVRRQPGGREEGGECVFGRGLEKKKR